MVYIHNQMGYWSINYLDDFGSAEPQNIAWDSYKALGLILESLGAKEAKEKSVPQCMRLEFLGNIVDSHKMTIEIVPTRKQQLMIELEKFYNRQYASKKEIQSLIGKLSFITNCVRAGRIFISRMIDIIKGKETTAG